MRGTARGNTMMVIAVTLAGAGCSSTPRHSNTLMFGTSTRVALDVSQEPTGSLGFTLGYKRQEAVWMPLLANKNDGGDLVPAECSETGCKVFQGQAGEGGAAGKGAVDTYSVLATFSGSASANAESPAASSGSAAPESRPAARAGGGIAQYFATGLAARLLAARGAAVVNAAAGETAAAPLSEDEKAAIRTAARQETLAVEEVIAFLRTKTGGIDGTNLDQLIQRASGLSPDAQVNLRKPDSASDLRDYLTLNYDHVGQRMHTALKKLTGAPNQ